MDMRILVTGSRQYPNEDNFGEYRVRQALKQYIDTYFEAAPIQVAAKHPFVLVHGACPTGPDAWADKLFIQLMDGKYPQYDPNMFDIVRVPIAPQEWEQYGKFAGPRRNEIMVSSYNCDFGIAFPTRAHTASHGTYNTISLMKQYSLPHDIWYPDAVETGLAF